MFTGLSAFPITPFKNEHIDHNAFVRIIENLVSANVESICAMGSTGLYPYLTRAQLSEMTALAVDKASGIPVMVGVGALRTFDVLHNVEAVQKAGANAVLLAPVSYHPLNEDEVFGLYSAVSQAVSIPVCVYENPRVTNFTFSDVLYRRIAELPNIGAIKIPSMPFATEQGSERLATLRGILPEHIAIGVSGDAFGAKGMAEGCDLWLSVIGGMFPRTVKHIIALAQSNESTDANTVSESLNGVWELFARNGGGLRVMAAAADILGFCEGNGLPSPFLPISPKDRMELDNLIKKLNLV